MPLRLSCLLLAFCLFWASFGASAAAPPAAPALFAGALAEAPAGECGPDGSGTDSLVEGLPAPAHGDPASEGAALLPPALLDMPALPAGRPHMARVPWPPAPYLEGLQRPPRAAGVSAG